MRIASQIPNSDQSPLYDVRNPARASLRDTTCEVMFRGRNFPKRSIFKAHFKGAHRSSIPSGGARRDRTDDLMLAKHALSQLSYGPVPEDECFASISETSVRRISIKEKTHSITVVGLGRLELPTSRLSSARSNQLSYKPLTLFLKKGSGPAHAQPAKLPAASHKRSPGACSSAKKEKRRRRNPANGAQQS